MAPKTTKTPAEAPIPKSPMRAIREKCIDCCAGSPKEVRECDLQSCPLFAFRNGRNPHRTKRVMTEEQRAVAVARLAAIRPKAAVPEYEDL